MPAWWGKKSSKNKQDKATKTFNNDIVAVSKKKASSFDGQLAPSNKNSPRGSRDEFSPSSSATGGSSSVGLPLPAPSGSASGTDQLNELCSGSGSTSESSVSSCGSSAEDHSINTIRSSRAHRGDGDLSFNTSRSQRRESRSPVPGSRRESRSPVPGSRSPVPGYRSPGPASTRPSRSASPIHPLLGCTNPESPTGRIEDAKNQCHPLPLPPSSPCSPSSLPAARNPVLFENTSVPVPRWKKGKLLGRGTFGHVYLGFNSEGGHMCAIKEVKVVSDDQTSKECLKQLNQEINLLSQLQHPNIVRYYGSELSDETLSVYLEYVSGGSIHKLLQEYGPFKEPVIQNYTRQIVFGLAYLHGKDTVHRDIKGANILVDPNGEIKLADFGMAKSITSCSSMLSFKGSPYWMAPEVVMNTNGYNLAVDIWSLGCTILEMATSKPPWSRYEGVAAIFKIGNSKDMPEIPDHLSNDAKKFIKLCLQRDPSARPSASQLLDHPFIQDQSTTKSFNTNMTRDAFPFNSDGTSTPPVFDLRPNRTNALLTNGDYAISPAVTSVCGLNTRDNIRSVTSLPVSPSSSPLRQSGRAHKSGLLSPPHLTYPLVGQSGYNMSDYSFFKRSGTLYSHDPGMESPFLQGQCHGTSPRTRLI